MCAGMTAMCTQVDTLGVYLTPYEQSLVQSVIR